MTLIWTREERTLEYYRNRHCVIVLGFFEDGALVTWAIIWNGKARSGRWPTRRKPEPEGSPK